MSSVVFVDTETTGLDPFTHEIWDLAIIESNGGEFEYHFPVNLTKADPKALQVGRYYERTGDLGWEWDSPKSWVHQIARQLDGKHLVGACPWFDAQFLRHFLLYHGHQATWRYHHIDIEALAVGYLAARGETVDLPYHSKDLSRRVGVDPDMFDAHTAIGDARWAKAVYEKILGGTE